MRGLFKRPSIVLWLQYRGCIRIYHYVFWQYFAMFKRMKKIISPDNALVKKALKLKDPRNRDMFDRCLVEGVRAVETFLNSPYKLNRIYITEKHLPWAQTHCKEEAIVIVSDQLMQKISSTVSPSGVIGMFDIPEQRPLTELTSGLVLANLQDPGNVGTLIRTATALNTCVVLIEGVNPYNQKVIQATAGTIAKANLFRCSWQKLVQHKKSICLSALVVKDGASIHAISTSPRQRLLVVGSEAHGLPPEWLAQCDDSITLPMPGGTESLNAAVAGSIALYMTFMKDNA